MKKVAILMATYNGEKFIREQLDSIICQTYKDWELYISDDCSTDRTREIIESYQDDRIVLFRENTGIHGACTNYFNLIEFMKEMHLDNYEYFFYCDQDDRWREDKIDIEVKALEKYTGPALVYSDLQIMNGEGKDTGKKMSDYTRLKLDSKYSLFFKHRYIWGTTMAHNWYLWDKIVIPDESYIRPQSHDNWLGKIAVLFGDIEYIDLPLLMYRRYESNVSPMPRESRISKDMPLKEFLSYYCTITGISIDFLNHQVSEPNAFKADYMKCVYSGWLNAIRFFHKYKINVTEGFISTAIFRLIFITTYSVNDGLVEWRRKRVVDFVRQFFKW